MSWKTIESAPLDELVLTKIDDEFGARNEQPMIRHGRLWFGKGSNMYAYYTPTHWKPLEEEQA